MRHGGVLLGQLQAKQKRAPCLSGGVQRGLGVQILRHSCQDGWRGTVTLPRDDGGSATSGSGPGPGGCDYEMLKLCLDDVVTSHLVFRHVVPQACCEDVGLPIRVGSGRCLRTLIFLMRVGIDCVGPRSGR